MKIMQDSMAHPHVPSAVDTSSWKNFIVLVSVAVLAIIFLVAGGWKTTDPFGMSARLFSAKVPGWLSLPGGILLGALEVFGAILLLIPRFRRWGALLIGLMLLFFMGWVGFYYNELRGKECECFPMLKRAVNPMFFVVDGIWLVMAALIYKWSRVSEGLRSALMILAAVAVFSAASYGVAYSQNSGKKAPDSITLEGKATPIGAGHTFLFFYDPECSHCDAAAKRMSKWNWKDTKVIGIPTRMPQFAADFMSATGLKAPNSSDLELLKQTFPFGDPPYGVSLENGRQKAGHPIFDNSEPEQSLRKLGFIE